MWLQNNNWHFDSEIVVATLQFLTCSTLFPAGKLKWIFLQFAFALHSLGNELHQLFALTQGLCLCVCGCLLCIVMQMSQDTPSINTANQSSPVRLTVWTGITAGVGVLLMNFYLWCWLYTLLQQSMIIIIEQDKDGEQQARRLRDRGRDRVLVQIMWVTVQRGTKLWWKAWKQNNAGSKNSWVILVVLEL